MSGTEDKPCPSIKCSGGIASDTKERKYYHAYEDRYRKVYEQGVRYWSAFPWELKGDLEGLDEFLKIYHSRRSAIAPRSERADAGRPRVLEPGCGEAPLAVTLLSRGFDYVGLDLATIALAKARERIEKFLSANHPSPVDSDLGNAQPSQAQLGEAQLSKRQPRQAGLGTAQLFQHDVTDLSFLEPQSYDLAIDNKLLHMLVLDSDRDMYLRGLRRALKPGALVLLKGLYWEDAYDGPVESFDDYMRHFAPDLTTVEERTAFNGDEELRVKLTRVPARPRSKDGYLGELGRHGFEVLTLDVVEPGFECRMVLRLTSHRIVHRRRRLCH